MSFKLKMNRLIVVLIFLILMILLVSGNFIAKIGWIEKDKKYKRGLKLDESVEFF